MARIRKGDLVQVVSGPKPDRGGDRGKQGRVIGIDGDRVIVEGLNYVKKHVRVGQTQRGTTTGGVETHEAPIHISNVALVDPETKLPARVGFTLITDDRGKTMRERFYKKSRRVSKKSAAKSTETEEKATKAAPKSTAKKATKAEKDSD
jgi:large subunit ribosomal protein L24